MKFSSRSRRETAHLDLTPMVDVVFQLVLFLILTTTFKKPMTDVGAKAPGIQVDLPHASAKAILSSDSDLNVWVANDDQIYLDDQAMSLADLRREFKKAAAKDDNTLVIIKADKTVAHGRVVAVMDAARAEGLARMAIATAADQP